MAQMVPLDNSLIDLASLRYCLPDVLPHTAPTSGKTARTAASVKVLSAPSAGTSSNKETPLCTEVTFESTQMSLCLCSSPHAHALPIPHSQTPLCTPPIPLPLCPSHTPPSAPLSYSSLSAPPIPLPPCFCLCDHPSPLCVLPNPPTPHPHPTLPHPPSPFPTLPHPPSPFPTLPHPPSPFPTLPHPPPRVPPASRAHASQRLVDALDSVPGGKALVLDASISGPLAFIAPIALLKVRGTTTWCGQTRTRASPAATHSTRSSCLPFSLSVCLPSSCPVSSPSYQVRADEDEGVTRSYSLQSLFLSPLLAPSLPSSRPVFLLFPCHQPHQILEQEGLVGDPRVAVGEYPLEMIPVDHDLLALDLHTIYKEGLVGDPRVAVGEYPLEIIPVDHDLLALDLHTLYKVILEQEGLVGDPRVAVGEYPLEMIPLDHDLLALDLHTLYKDVHVDSDPTSTLQVARVLANFQSVFGVPPVLKGKGVAAQRVAQAMRAQKSDVYSLLFPACVCLTRSPPLTVRSVFGVPPVLKGKGVAAQRVAQAMSQLMKEQKSHVAPVEHPSVDMMVLIDRQVDMVTPACTQLTYEGLLDELLHVANGAVEVDPAVMGVTSNARKIKVPLNSNDKLFQDLRGRNFGSAAELLRAKAVEMKSEYANLRQRPQRDASPLRSAAAPGDQGAASAAGSGGGEQTVSELKDFVKKLNVLPELTRHTNLAGHISQVTNRPAFGALISTEQTILEARACEYIEDAMSQGHPMSTVLRLLSLVSLTNGGIPKARFDHLSPRDIAFTFSGYAPLSVRLLQQAIQPGGWPSNQEAGPSESVPRLVAAVFLGGVTFAEIAALRFLSMQSVPRLVAAVFLGGVTFAEIAALRFLSMQAVFLGGVTFAEIAALRFLSMQVQAGGML
ncbi:unnamed protein product [Closterium sp. Naga37s-1]|nr:unnamed protein product [Closterium sp. Naga37s-1]